MVPGASVCVDCWSDVDGSCYEKCAICQGRLIPADSPRGEWIVTNRPTINAVHCGRARCEETADHGKCLCTCARCKLKNAAPPPEHRGDGETPPPRRLVAVPPAADRCKGTIPGATPGTHIQCERPVGHLGRHRSGDVWWAR